MLVHGIMLQMMEHSRGVAERQLQKGQLRDFVEDQCVEQNEILIQHFLLNKNIIGLATILASIFREFQKNICST